MFDPSMYTSEPFTSDRLTMKHPVDSHKDVCRDFLSLYQSIKGFTDWSITQQNEKDLHNPQNLSYFLAVEE